MNEKKHTTPSRIAALRWEGDFSERGLIEFSALERCALGHLSPATLAPAHDAPTHLLPFRSEKALPHDLLRFFVHRSRPLEGVDRCRSEFAFETDVHSFIASIAQILHPMLE